MAKARVQFLCNSCGSVHPKWMGKCPDCGTWDSLEEYKAPTADARRAATATGDVAHAAEALRLADIDHDDAPRTATGIGEFDRVVGGGIVPGSAILVGGEPGIGKSTLLLQVANALAGENRPANTKRKHAATEVADSSSNQSATSVAASSVLYVTSEESARQTKLRAA